MLVSGAGSLGSSVCGGSLGGGNGNGSPSRRWPSAPGGPQGAGRPSTAAAASPMSPYAMALLGMPAGSPLPMQQHYRLSSPADPLLPFGGAASAGATAQPPATALANLMLGTTSPAPGPLSSASPTRASSPAHPFHSGGGALARPSPSAVAVAAAAASQAMLARARAGGAEAGGGVPLGDASLDLATYGNKYFDAWFTTPEGKGQAPLR